LNYTLFQLDVKHKNFYVTGIITIVGDWGVGVAYLAQYFIPILQGIQIRV
jgi:hypothetical protein